MNAQTQTNEKTNGWFILLGALIGALLVLAGYLTARITAPKWESHAAVPSAMPTATPTPTPTAASAGQLTATAAGQTAEQVQSTATPQIDSSVFGQGVCYSNGTSYTLVSYADGVESPGANMNVALATYGGVCVVDTFRSGFLYALSANSITWNGQNIPTNPPAQGIPAPPGHWVIVFQSPRPGERNDSNGLLFKTSPSVNPPEEKRLAVGVCTTGNGVTYQIYSDSENAWQEGKLLDDLVQYGGQCQFTTKADAWYWSVNGSIIWNGQKMPNGNCLKAPAGEWVITYSKASKNNGFAFHVNPDPWGCP